MLHLVLAVTLTAMPSPTASPLRTILNESVSPFCTTLHQNIGHSMQALMANDAAIAASKPVLVAMSHDYISPDIINQTGLGNLHGPALVNHDSPQLHLDSERIQEIAGAITHNLQLIDQQLKDAHFPQSAKTQDDRKLLEMRTQLEDIKAQQLQTLNVLEGLIDTQNMESVAGRGADILNLFGLNDGNNAKINGTNQVFNNGPLAATPDQILDPMLKASEMSALSNSVFGRFYRVVYLEQQRITALEQPFAKNVIEAVQRCGAAARP
jgi:hypothetical protein